MKKNKNLSSNSVSRDFGFSEKEIRNQLIDSMSNQKYNENYFNELDENLNFSESKNNKSKKIEYGYTGLEKNLSSQCRTKRLEQLSKHRGVRVRMLRNLIGNTIEEMAEATGLSVGTIGRIERAYTCLNIHNAYSICCHANRNGIHVTPNWLLSGCGQSRQLPQFVKNEEFSLKDYFLNKSDVDSDSTKLDNDSSPEMIFTVCLSQMFEEIFGRDTITTVMKDKKMQPFLFKGDMVMGKKINDINDAHRQICIVEYDQKKIVRLVEVNDENILLKSYCPEDSVLILNKKPQSIYRVTLRYMGSPQYLYTEEDED